MASDLKSVLRIDIDNYVPNVSANVFDLREARAEYSRLRKVANKRLMRLEKTGYGDTSVYQRYAGTFEALPKNASESQVRKALYEVAKYTELKTGSVTGQKLALERYVETMQERGFEDITVKNARIYGRFMALVKRHYGSKKAFVSEEVYEDFIMLLDDADTDDVEEIFDMWKVQNGIEE